MIFRVLPLVVAGALIIYPPASADAQGTGFVAASDLIYADIEQLAAFGVLDSVLLGQRPYSRREIARLAGIARARMQNGGSQYSDTGYIDALVQRIDRFNDAADTASHGGPVVSLIDGASLSFTFASADRRRFPASYSRLTEATIDPLASRRLGKPAVRGQTAALELSHRVEPTGWLSLQARERIEYRRPYDTTGSRQDGELLLASARARYRNAALTVGRQQFTWSQTAGDGLFLASNAPALDQIALSGDHPFALPGFLRLLGPTQATLIVADLGPSAVRSHSKLLGYKVSIAPTSDVELGGTFMNHYGGTGGRSSTFKNHFFDFVPFLDVFRKHNYVDATKEFDVDSDKLLGVDGRVRLDALGGFVLTGEMLIDDFDVHLLRQLLTTYGSSRVGIIFPQIGSPAVSARLTAKHMGVITYTHFDLTNGITSRGRLLGDELGTDSKSFSGQLRLAASPNLALELEGRSAIYSNEELAGTLGAASRTPNELRELLFATLIAQADGIALTVRGGAQRIRNADFQGGRRRDYVAEIALSIGQSAAGRNRMRRTGQ